MDFYGRQLSANNNEMAIFISDIKLKYFYRP